MYLSIGVGRDAEGRLELLDDLREERHLEIGDVADGQQNPSVLLMQGKGQSCTTTEVSGQRTRSVTSSVGVWPFGSVIPPSAEGFSW